MIILGIRNKFKKKMFKCSLIPVLFVYPIVKPKSLILRDFIFIPFLLKKPPFSTDTCSTYLFI